MNNIECVCGHKESEHADRIDRPCATDHCEHEGCSCTEYEPKEKRHLFRPRVPGPIVPVYLHPWPCWICKVYAVPPGIERRLVFRSDVPFRCQGFAMLNGNVDDWLVHSVMVGNVEQYTGAVDNTPCAFSIFRGDAPTLQFPTVHPGVEIAITVSHSLDRPTDIEVILCGVHTGRES